MSSAAPNPIRLPVVVEFDQATGALRTFRRVAAAETQAAAGEMARNLTVAERTVGRSADTMREKIRGIGPAISSVSNSLTLLGAQGTPAVNGLTRAISGLAVGGFTPVGIAIGLASAALGAWITSSNEAEESAKRHAAAEKERAAEIQKVTEAEKARDRERLAAAGASGMARTSGLPESVVRARNDLAELNRQFDAIAARMTVGGAMQLGQLRKEIAAAEERLRVEEQIAVLRGENLFPFNPSAPVEPVILGEPSGGRTTRRTVDPGAPFGISSLTNTRGVQDRRVVDAIRQAQASEQINGLISQFGMPAHSGFYRNPLAVDQPTRPENIELTSFDDVLNQAAGQRTAEEEAAREQIVADYGKSFGDAFTSGVKSASMTLIQSGDFGGFFRSITDQMQNAIIDGILSGFLEGLGLRQAGASLGESLFSAFSGTAAAATTGVAAKSAMAETPILVVVGADEAGADGMMKKASANGVRAAFAKANGQGIAATSIPSRRRR